MDITTYKPLTAEPFKSCPEYMEILPCPALRPYIRCFWGSKGTVRSKPEETPRKGLVIPDTCMDIILDINFTGGCYGSFFCGINDLPFISCGENSNSLTATFAIRFYAWSVILFTGEDMSSALNCAEDTERYFSGFKRELEERLVYCSDIYTRTQAAEKYLLERLDTSKLDPGLMNAVDYIIRSNGNIRVPDICGYTAVSLRTLERLFVRNTGAAPKKLVSMIRCQLLWQDILRDGFDVQDAVLKYGYTDQPHLLRDFRRFCTMTPSQLKKYAAQKV